MGTNKQILMKGITYLGWALPFMAIGPVILFNAFQNEKHPFFIPVLGIGIIICGSSIYLMFKGINTIMKSMFHNEK
jgi:hypothetical protein